MDLTKPLQAIFKGVKAASPVEEASKPGDSFAAWWKALIQQYKDEGKFQEIILQGNIEFTDMEIALISEIAPNEIRLSLRLALGLYYKYQSTRKFNFLQLYFEKAEQATKLPIDTFYVDLSYIPEREQVSRVVSRKQANDTPLYIQRGPRLSFTSSNQDYIHQNILQNSRQLIVAGAPGTGKSTFAHKLCHYWRRNMLEDQRQIIYLQLRDLRFGQSNAIIEYINNEYLEGDISQETGLRKLIKTVHENYLFLMDGYDELPSNHRNQLFRDLFQISENINYILFTRPYALVHHQPPCDLHLQIDGFNESSICRYIEILSGKMRKAPDLATELLNLIKSNHMLEELSHNPLMLSYLAAIYFNNNAGKDILQKIDSAYELQLTVFRWAKGYADAKMLEQTNSFLPPLKELENFAWDIHRYKEFVIRGQGLVDEREKIAQHLSESGIGVLRPWNESWTFSFNSVTLQEFFASGYVARHLDTVSFEYLIKDLFFWNFMRMIAGYSHANGLESIVSPILDHLLQLHQMEGKRYYMLLYYHILSESSEELITTSLDKKKVIEMIGHYHEASLDENWDSVFLEIITRIFHKLSAEQKKAFFTDIIERVEKIRPENFRDQPEYFDVYYLHELITSIGFYTHPGLSDRIIKLCSNLLEELQNNNRKIEAIDVRNNPERMEELKPLNIYESGLTNVLFFLIHSIQSTGIADLYKIKAPIEELASFRNEDLLIDISNIRGKLMDYDEAENELKVGIKHLDKIDSLETYEKHRLISGTATDFHIFCQKLGEKDHIPEALIPWIQDIAHQLVNLGYEYGIPPDRMEGIEDAVIFSLRNCRNSELLRDMFMIIDKVDSAVSVDIQDYQIYEEFLNSLAKEIRNESDTNIELNRLFIRGFKHCHRGMYLVSRFRNDIYEVFRNLVIENALWINDETDFDALGEYERDVLNCLVNLSDIFDMDYDKRFMLDCMREDCGLNTFPYVRETFTGYLFSTDFSFYQPEYWNMLNPLLFTGKQMEVSIAFLSENRSIFKYEANSQNIIRIVDQISTSEFLENIDLSDWGDALLSFSSQLLQSRLILSGSAETTGTIEKLARILRHPKIREMAQNDQAIEYLGSTTMAGFSILYFLTQNKKDLSEISYEQIMKGFLSQKRYFAETMIEYFSPLKGGFLANFKKIESELGPEIFNYVKSTYLDFAFEDYQYTPDHIQALLQKGENRLH